MKSGVVTLRSIELAGFKSFAKRTKIEFGDGLVAIVGPNGSGKSNIADAIRWVFGEQKNKTLRTEKSEDIIYNGGDGKARASMAEVVITLDNSSGVIPLDLFEIEITRRLYRSGESNYLLNGKKVSLGSIQELLASSGFGVGSYTIIGQGMIDRLILATGLERKQLFEEASGIKHFEMKLQQTTKRIDTTRQNLTHIGNLISELKPQQQALDRQADLLSQRTHYIDDIQSYRLAYINQSQSSEHKLKQECQAKLDEHQMSLGQLKADLTDLEDKYQASSQPITQDSAGSVTKLLDKTEASREGLSQQISTVTLELLNIKSQLASSNPLIEKIVEEIQFLKGSIIKHDKTHQSLQQHLSVFESMLDNLDDKIKHQTAILNSTRKQLGKSQKTQYLSHSLGLIDILQDRMEQGKSYTELSVVFYKLRRMIKHSIKDNSAELALKVGRVQNAILSLLDEREKITEAQTNEVIKLRASEMDSSSISAKISELQKQLSNLQQPDTTTKLKKVQKSLQLQLTKLVDQKTSITVKVADQRQALVTMAGRNDSVIASNYYAKHEKLTNQKVQLNQNIQQYSGDLGSINIRLKELEKLHELWFKGNTTGIKSLSKVVDMSMIDRLEAEIELLQEINPDVANGAKLTSERMLLLESQRNDLAKAVDDLSRVLKDTSKEMQNEFSRGFNKVNKYFGQNFTNLFGGGKAELLLKQTNDDYGVEILVQLPKQKPQNLSSLSGGEKALASVALLAGILMASPSPFVVLDEVDAALDAANTKKFAKLLAEITKHSQVLVVTHNHDTMVAASELLGVTTTHNKDSHIVRVWLDSLPVGSITK